MCHMLTCGNNDLIDKKYSNAFAYYSTFENSPWNSVHAWDLGYTHFVCLNSNEDYTFEGMTPTQFIAAQCEWLDNHLTEVNQRDVKPRWIICYMHISPFTIVRTKRVQPFIPIFEKHKVPLVLCGHNHTYSRSKAIYSGYNGTDAYNDYTHKTSTIYYRNCPHNATIIEDCDQDSPREYVEVYSKENSKLQELKQLVISRISGM